MSYDAATSPNPVPATVRVAIPVPVDEQFTYLVPGELTSRARPGYRVLVPFGPRKLTGVVVEETREEGKYKSIIDILDSEPAFSAEMLRLTRWMADYYVCGWGEVLRAALPAGIEVESERLVYRGERTAGEWRGADSGKEILRVLGDESPLPARQLAKRISSNNLSMALLREMESAQFLRLEAEIMPASVRIKTGKFVWLDPALRESAAGQEALSGTRGKRQRAVLEELASLNGRAIRQAELMNRTSASHASVEALLKRGLIRMEEREIIRTPYGNAAVDSHQPVSHALHPAQNEALSRISSAVDEHRFETFLLHGVTGSGKTEVYIRALKTALEAGRTGIVLVPEIALTPQTVQRFKAHFGDCVAVLHSRMSGGERFDAWRHLKTGRFSIAIGPRSAVLAPLGNLGIIIVDEEHEASYKQFDPAPRYHARDVAVMRARMENAVCVLGSATPSLESYHNGMSGKFTLLKMTDRVPVAGYEAAPMPRIDVVDLTREKNRKRLHGTISETLRAAIEQRLDRREQVILLQNRRGYVPVIECMSCGWTRECVDCAVTMTYHKLRNQLRCHYCGRTARLPKFCQECSTGDLALLGAGTQKVEEELQALFPQGRLLRMDMDTTSRKGAHGRILETFGSGSADILIGTQMIAKGLDFPKVTLVGVINADTGLLLPDFRAGERTFQLLTQVSGRSGRAELRGEVIIQTRKPKDSVITHAVGHDYESFARQELQERERLFYPPFSRVIALEARGTDRQRIAASAEEWARCIRERFPHIVVLGPEEAFVARLKQKYRYHIIMKIPGGHMPRVKAGLPGIVKTSGRRSGTDRAIIDVDPVALL